MAFGPITDAQRVGYQENVTLALQQKRSRYRDYFTFQPNLKGRVALAIEVIGQETAIIDGTRGGDTPAIEGSVEDTWMKPRQVEWGKLVEKEDQVKNMTDYTSTYVQTGAAAIARGEDSILRQSFYGPRLVGQDGTSSEALTLTADYNFVPVNYVASGAAANSGITIEKLNYAITLLAANEVDLERDVIAMSIGAKQENQLYNLLQYTSKDYRDKAVLDTARQQVVSFAGINFVRDQNLPTNGTAKQRRCPLWVKSGMHYAEFDPLTTQMERNPQKKFRVQAYLEEWFGATRGENGKVIMIDCLEP
ncbi:phage capsid protein [Pleomorphomonas koreensis]|uniref:phage capsid protein n=1 Tax=Pleomorphomonas koreensis TaxID=257440 RepID=UPI00041EDE7C|nr:phage capsid protein [Pleomorphomonas koreensis]